MSKLNYLKGVFLLVFFLICNIVRVVALGPTDVSVTMTTAPFFIADSNSPPQMQGPKTAYVGFEICNTSGGTLTDLEVTMSNITGTVPGFALTGGQPADQYIGTLDDGDCITKYWYVEYPYLDKDETGTFEVTVSDNAPGTVVESEDVLTRNSISANAGGMVLSRTLGPGIYTGQIFYMDVDYEFGNVQNGDEFTFQPAGNLDFDADCYQLLSAEVLASDLGGIGISAGTQNQFYFVASGSMGGSGHIVSVRYYFRSNCVGMGTTAQPYAGQTSGGANFKYTGNFEDPGLAIPPSTNAIQIDKSVADQLIPVAPGQTSYTITLQNTSDQIITIDRIDDVLPGGFTYNSLDLGSNITPGNSAMLPGFGDGGAISFIGGLPSNTFPYFSYVIQPMSSIELIYVIDIPMGTPDGTYTNSATATMGQFTTPNAMATLGVGACTVEADCPDDINVNVDPGLCAANVSFPAAMGSGTCPPIAVNQTMGLASGSDFPVGINTIEFTATDVNMNTATCQFTITVVDNELPTINCPSDMSVNTDPDLCTAEVDYDVTTDDNCPGEILFQTMGLGSGADFPVGVTTNSFLVTDGMGNSNSCSFTITVEDMQAPEALCDDLPVVLDIFGQASIVPADIDNGSSDNCGNISLDLDVDQFDCSTLGMNTVTLTVTDDAGNSSDCSATVTVVEGEAPCDPAYDINGSEHCTCLDNATNLNNGQFAEWIQVEGLAGMTWTVLSSSGFYLDSSPDPPFPPIPVLNGTVLPDGSADGLDNDNDMVTDEPDEARFYTLSGIHVEGNGYNLMLKNEVNQIISIANLCYYPTPQFTNLDGPFCPGTAPFPIGVEELNGAAGTVQTFVNGQPETVFDPASLGIGTHTVTAIYDAGSATANLVVNGVPVGPSAQDAEEDPGCIQEITQDVEVIVTSDQLVCNPVLNLGLESDCITTIHPDMVLEGSYYCYDDYIVYLSYPLGTNSYNPPIIIDASHIGYLVDYTVVHIPSGNTCSGVINVEDNLDPMVTCPSDLQILCVQDYENLAITGQPTVNDCSDYDIHYFDQFNNVDCADDPLIAAVITRTWIITDEYGNSTNCIQTIEVLRGSLDQVTLPGNISFSCTMAPPDLSPDNTGWPTIAGQEITDTEDYLCDITVTYSDIVSEDCPGITQVVRTWTLYDFCPPNGDPFEVLEQVQIINLNDEPPVITLPLSMYDPVNDWWVVSANGIAGGPNDPCAAWGPLPVATADGMCNDIVSIVINTQIGTVPNGGQLPIPGLGLGLHQVTYVATDECGSMTELTVTINVVDDVSPTVVCDEITEVDISSDGLAVVNADVFDDGSYDNCCLDYFAVRRADGDCEGNYDDFGPTVTFCCSDVGGAPVMVIMRVYDCFDNYNDCMVEVMVDDKLPPTAITCPSSTIISCEEYWEDYAFALDLGDYSVLDDFGSPVFDDNCTYTVEDTVEVNINTCSEGTIIRTWVAVDDSGNFPVVCSQTIEVEHVSDWVVSFPPDMEANCEDGTLPDFGEPQIFYDECELIAVSYEDTRYDIVPDACYKIVRDWTVINWCIYEDFGYDAYANYAECTLALDWDGDGDFDCRTFRDGWNNSGTPGEADGFIAYQQIIKVHDTEAPIFTVEDLDVCIQLDECFTDVFLPAPDVMDCSDGVEIIVTSNLPNPTGDQYVFTEVPPGIYSAEYEVTDNCGNVSFAEIVIDVRDCFKPTPICVSGLAIDIMPTGMIDISPEPYDNGSFDNCPGDLLLSFSQDVEDTVLVFTCDDLGENTIEIWVTDAAGNQDYCETTIDVQDNLMVCNTLNDPIVVAGLIQTEEQDGMEGVMVDVNGGFASQITGFDGTYELELPEGGDYSVTPMLDVDAVNGVTTYDMVLVSRHILNEDLLDSPYKVLAADANRSGMVTTLDLVAIRKVILLIEDSFPNNTSWRFVEADHIFSDPNQPWADGVIPEILNFNNLDVPNLQSDFIALKVGDVNGSAQANSLQAIADRTFDGKTMLQVADHNFEAGEQVEVPVYLTDTDLLGCQFTLHFDPGMLSLSEMGIGLASAENFGFSFVEEGVLTFSWHQMDAMDDLADVPLFTLVFSANRPGQLSQSLVIGSNYTRAEAYQAGGPFLQPQLEFTGQQEAATVLYQNKPNPFHGNTVIGFYLPEPMEATLRISDLSGRTLQEIPGTYSAGYHERMVSDLPATGVLYYQLETPNQTITKKMVVLE